MEVTRLRLPVIRAVAGAVQELLEKTQLLQKAAMAALELRQR